MKLFTIVKHPTNCESVPDDENGSGGFVFRGGKDHSNFSGLPGLQQETQDTVSCYVTHILSSLYTNTKEQGGKRFGGKAT